MKSEELIRIAARHQVFIERFKQKTVDDYIGSFRQFEKEFRSYLMELDFELFNQLTKKQLAEAVRDLKTIYSNIQKGSVAKLYDEFEKFASVEAGFEFKSLDKLFKGKVGLQSGAQKAFSAALNNPLSANGQLVRPFIKTWSANQQSQVTGVIQQAWREGWSFQQIYQRVKGTKARKYKDGLSGLQSRQASSVIRSTLQHVSSEARFVTWDANKDVVTGYRWVSTLDNRTIPICRSLDGDIFELNKGPRPPIHFNCRSTTAAEIDDDLGLDFLDDDATRSAKFGPVDADETYYQWLKKQSKEFQIEVLGPNKQRILEAKGAEWFKENSIDSYFRPITLDELSAKAQIQLDD